MNAQDKKDLNKAINSRRKWYVGLLPNGDREAFSTFEDLSLVSGKSEMQSKGLYPYNAVIGAFKTKRAALWVEKHGKNNPHFQTVKDAERLASEEKHREYVLNLKRLFDGMKL
jgi:hypothetical protein